MKTIAAILTLIIPIQVFGQSDPESELSRIFYSLPIRSDIETIINSAKTVDMIQAYGNHYYNSSSPYFTGYISKNEYFSEEQLTGQLEIFRSSYYTLRGTELDSLDVLYMNLEFGDTLTPELKKQYKSLVKTFRKQTGKSEKYKLYADPGLVGYGYYFFKSGKDKLPFMAIEIGLGDCVSHTKSLIVKYFKIPD